MWCSGCSPASTQPHSLSGSGEAITRSVAGCARSGCATNVDARLTIPSRRSAASRRPSGEPSVERPTRRSRRALWRWRVASICRRPSSAGSRRSSPRIPRPRTAAPLPLDCRICSAIRRRYGEYAPDHEARLARRLVERPARRSEPLGQDVDQHLVERERDNDEALVLGEAVGQHLAHAANVFYALNVDGRLRTSGRGATHA